MAEKQPIPSGPRAYVGNHSYKIIGMGSQIGSVVVNTRKQAEDNHWYRKLNGGPLQRVLPDQAVETSGTVEKRRTDDNETVITMAVGAAQAALGIAAMTKKENYTEDEQKKINELGVILINTSSPDDPLSPLGPKIADALGANNVETLDFRQTCAAIPYLLKLVSVMLESGAYGKYALVISTDDLPAIINPDDYGTASLFGAGAAALHITTSDPDHQKVLCFKSKPMGYLSDLLNIEQGGSVRRVTVQGLHENRDKIFMNGAEVYKEMVAEIPELTKKFLEETRLPIDDIDHIIIHPGSGKIEENLPKKLKKCGLDPKKVLPSTLDVHGNMSAASSIETLEKAYREGKLNPGDYILIIGFGAGMHASIALIEWSLPNPNPNAEVHERKPKKFVCKQELKKAGHELKDVVRDIRNSIVQRMPIFRRKGHEENSDSKEV